MIEHRPDCPAIQAADICQRPLVVLFWDIAGSCELLARLSLEEFRNVVRARQEEAANLIQAQGGFVARYMGDAILAYFGYPENREDDAERAVHAALNLRTASDESGTACRVTIASGPVIVDAALGHATLQEIPAFGEAPNLAARLLCAARPNDIVVDCAVRAAADGLFGFIPLTDLHLKGFPHIRTAWRVTGRCDAKSRFAARRGIADRLGPCIGRQATVATLMQHIRSTPRTVAGALVTGDAGIGKSHLLYSVAEALSMEGALILQGDFTMHARGGPYAALAETIRRGLGIPAAPHIDALRISRAFHAVGLNDPDHEELFLGLLGMRAINTDGYRHENARVGLRIRHLLIDLLRRIGSRRKTVLLLDDLHWADRAAHDLIAAIAQSGDPDLPFLLLSSRQAAPPAGFEQLLHVPLAPLSTADIEQILRAKADSAALPPARLTAIATRSEGNTLFAEQMLMAAQENTLDPLHVPDVIARLVVSRLDRLDHDTQRLLRQLSVLGVQCAPDTLTRFPGLCIGRIGELAHQGDFITVDAEGGIRFRHALIQASIYSTLLPSQRQALHRRFAESLEADQRQPVRADLLAHHFLQGNDLIKAVRYLLLSGDERMALYALDDADACFAQAMTPAAQLGGTVIAQVLARRMRVLELTCAFNEIIRLAEQHLPTILEQPDAEETGAVLIHYAHALLHGHQPQRAVKIASMCRNTAERFGRSLSAAHAKLVLMKALNVDDDPANLALAETIGRDILDVATTTGDVSLACATRFQLAAHHLHDGQLRRAHIEAMALLTLGEQHQDARADAFGHWLLGWIAVHDFRYGDALHYAERSLSTAAIEADRLVGLGLKGLVLAVSGHPREGLVLLQQAYSTALDRHDLHLVSALDPGLGVALILTGQPAAGLKHLRTTMTRRMQDGYAMMAGYAHLLLGELYVRLSMQKFSATAPKLTLVARATMGIQLLFARNRAIRHLRLAARIQRWQPTSAARIRISIALAMLQTRADQTLTVTAEAAAQAGLDGLAHFARRFATQ